MVSGKLGLRTTCGVMTFLLWCLTAHGLADLSSANAETPEGLPLSATITTLTIPQVDYEPAVFYTEGDPYPHVDFNKVNPKKIVQQKHAAVILENEFVRIAVLPEMGRVYSFLYKPTGHEELWHNDIATALPQGGNPLGFWLWIGGVEYTLPFAEHGSTFALRWTWTLQEDSAKRKTVSMKITEPRTKLEETLDVSLYPSSAYYETSISISNTTSQPVDFAHWINPQWTPGGHNELTDKTEFILPTDHIVISKEWQENMGPSPQTWAANTFRSIAGWKNKGDLNAGGLNAGFYSAYSHDEEEGIVRVFDKDKTPGVDIWTYGFHPTDVPMGSGGTSKGYAEMWGGTSRIYGEDMVRLAAGKSLQWTEWMYPYQKTGGLTFADKALAIKFSVDETRRKSNVNICPSGQWKGSVILSYPLNGTSAAKTPNATAKQLMAWSLDVNPQHLFSANVSLKGLNGTQIRGLRLQVTGTDGTRETIKPDLQ